MTSRSYTARKPASPMVNRYPGPCRSCGGRVEAGDGFWTRQSGCVHAACPVTITSTEESYEAAQAPVEPARVAVEDQGVYVMPDGAIVKVQANKAKDRTYAKRWTEIGGERLNEADEHVHGDYIYEAGLASHVAAEGRKMTAAEAVAFVVRYGRCVRCNRHLRDATSVEQGLGPTCVEYFGGRKAVAEAIAASNIAASTVEASVPTSTLTVSA